MLTATLLLSDSVILTLVAPYQMPTDEAHGGDFRSIVSEEALAIRDTVILHTNPGDAITAVREHLNIM